MAHALDWQQERVAHVARLALVLADEDALDRQDQRRRAVRRRLEGDHLMTLTTVPTAAEAPHLAAAEAAARHAADRPGPGWIVRGLDRGALNVPPLADRRLRRASSTAPGRSPRSLGQRAPMAEAGEDRRCAFAQNADIAG